MLGSIRPKKKTTTASAINKDKHLAIIKTLKMPHQHKLIFICHYYKTK